MRKSTLSVLIVLIAVLTLVSAASAAVKAPDLPATVQAKIIYPAPSGITYFDVIVTSGGGDIPAKTYYGWCADSKTSIVSGQSHTFGVYSSLDSTNIEPTIDSADWKKINYVLNQKTVTNKYLIQHAIWYYDGGFNANTNWGSFTAAEWNAFLADIEANGASYVPDEAGEVFAVVLHYDNIQDVIIPVPLEEQDIPVPEFPTLALPVAMVLGVVFTLHVVKSRKD